MNWWVMTPEQDPGASVVFRDVTAQREAEARLEGSNAALAHANELLRVFRAG